MRVSLRVVLALSAGLMLLAASACRSGEDSFAEVPEELAEAVEILLEGEYTLTFSSLGEDGTVQRRIQVQRIGVDRVRRLPSGEEGELIAVEHTSYTEDPDNPGRYLSSQIGSAVSFDPAYLILENLGSADGVTASNGVYTFIVSGGELLGSAEVSVRLSGGLITEMTVDSPEGRSRMEFDYADVPPIEAPPPGQVAPVVPRSDPIPAGDE
jgi:hypothetical protein